MANTTLQPYWEISQTGLSAPFMVKAFLNCLVQPILNMARQEPLNDLWVPYSLFEMWLQNNTRDYRKNI